MKIISERTRVDEKGEERKGGIILPGAFLYKCVTDPQMRSSMTPECDIRHSRR